MTQTYTTEEQEERKAWFYKNWPFKLEIPQDKHWEQDYYCFHCTEWGKIKNYRRDDEDFILCEFENCHGNALDMKVCDREEEEAEERRILQERESS